MVNKEGDRDSTLYSDILIQWTEKSVWTVFFHIFKENAPLLSLHNVINVFLCNFYCEIRPQTFLISLFFIMRTQCNINLFKKIRKINSYSQIVQ